MAREALGPLLADRSTVVVAREALGPLLAARLWPAKPWGHYWQLGGLVVVVSMKGLRWDGYTEGLRGKVFSSHNGQPPEGFPLC